eukprot:TRINITY_DN1264_c0_g1_i3.p3 TRINITY_DN1264_c0_g1~~TRINITY_DN1264_c0_g1_i3.p3  ORF type:complete len:79 (+),score=18.41 TRINITY_DN1264_c0_g1_i3:19-255(+)
MNAKQWYQRRVHGGSGAKMASLGALLRSKVKPRNGVYGHRYKRGLAKCDVQVFIRGRRFQSKWPQEAAASCCQVSCSA